MEAEEGSEEQRLKVEKKNGNKILISSLLRVQGEKRTVSMFSFSGEGYFGFKSEGKI